MKPLKILFIIPLLFAIACHHGKTDEHQHNTEAEATHQHAQEESIFLTQYTNRFELFAECAPLAVNEPAEILGHFTLLPQFKPLNDGKINVSLIINGEKIASAVGSKLQSGIFDFDMQAPTKAGNGELIFTINSTAINDEISVPVTVFADEHKAEEAAHAAEPKTPNVVVFTKEQSWENDFSTTLPRFEPFGEVIKSTAKVEPASGQEMTHSTGMSGFVNFELKSLTEGQRIKANQTVISIEEKNRTENSIAVKYQAAKNNFETAKANYERISKLASENIVSQSRLQEATRNYQNARAEYENYQKNYSAGKQIIVCAQSGYIKKLLVKNGQFVEAGTPLFVMAHNNSLFLKAAIAQRYTQAINHLDDAVIKCPGCQHNLLLSEINGKVVSVGQSLSEGGFMVPVTLEIDRHEDLLPGSLVEVLLKTTSDQAVISIPNSALLEEQGNFSVFVQITPEMFEKRRIVIGATDGLFTEVKSGLQRNERVVNKGAILIKLSAASGKLDPHAGHVH